MAYYIMAHQARADRVGLPREALTYAHNGDFKRYLGMESDEAKWPASSIDPVVVPLKDGRFTAMWLDAPLPAKLDSRGRKIKSSAHRCMTLCPDCEAVVPAGRTHQHKCKA